MRALGAKILEDLRECAKKAGLGILTTPRSTYVVYDLDGGVAMATCASLPGVAEFVEDFARAGAESAVGMAERKQKARREISERLSEIFGEDAVRDEP